MGRYQQSLFAAAAVVGAVSFTQEAGAITPVKQGTLAVAAERLVASNLHIADGYVGWNNQLLGSPGWVPFDTPRLGVDYFIIDGLSVGGHLGLGFFGADNNDGAYVALLPRVGYAFSISKTIDFWPRGGIGIIAGDYASDTAVIGLEAMFLANLKDYFALEFGPAIDIPLSDLYQDLTLGANAGFVVKF